MPSIRDGDQSGELYSSVFLIKYFIFRVLLTSYRRDYDMQIYLGWTAAQILVPFHVFCCLTPRVHAYVLHLKFSGSLL